MNTSHVSLPKFSQMWPDKKSGCLTITESIPHLALAICTTKPEHQHILDLLLLVFLMADKNLEAPQIVTSCNPGCCKITHGAPEKQKAIATILML